MSLLPDGHHCHISLSAEPACLLLSESQILQLMHDTTDVQHAMQRGKQWRPNGLVMLQMIAEVSLHNTYTSSVTLHMIA